MLSRGPWFYSLQRALSTLRAGLRLLQGCRLIAKVRIMTVYNRPATWHTTDVRESFWFGRFAASWTVSYCDMVESEHRILRSAVSASSQGPVREAQGG